MTLKWIGALVLSSTLVCGAIAQSQESAPVRKASSHQIAASTDDAAAARGEKVFQQNCARCHNAPQGFSSQISATIVRHMRVRASVSARDERDLLRFLNP